MSVENPDFMDTVGSVVKDSELETNTGNIELVALAAAVASSEGGLVQAAAVVDRVFEGNPEKADEVLHAVGTTALRTGILDRATQRDLLLLTLQEQRRTQASRMRRIQLAKAASTRLPFERQLDI